VWRGFEQRERPVRSALVRRLTSDIIIPHAPIDSLPFSVFNHARILTSGVYGPESEAAYFTSASVYSMPRLDLCVCEGHRVCRALGLRVVCGVGVCVRVLGYALHFVVLFLSSA
jgi:hypothetical protein